MSLECIYRDDQGKDDYGCLSMAKKWGFLSMAKTMDAQAQVSYGQGVRVKDYGCLGKAMDEQVYLRRLTLVLGLDSSQANHTCNLRDF